MFSKDQRFWILAHIFRGLGFLDLGTCFQRIKGVLGFGSCFRCPKVLDLGSCFQRLRIFGSWVMFSKDHGFFGLWLMFSEVQRFFGLWLMFSKDQRFWILAHVFIDLGFLDRDSCF